MTTITSDRLVLTREDLARLGINISNTTLLRLEASGSVPKRLRIGNTVTWLAAEVREYISGLAAEREAA